MRAQDPAALRFEMVETGRLTEGDANPASPAYNSLADVAYGDHAVSCACRGPAQLPLNPAQMQVHADYYAHYGGRPGDRRYHDRRRLAGGLPDADASDTSDAMGASGAMDEDSRRGIPRARLHGAAAPLSRWDEFPVKGCGGDVSYRERPAGL